MLTVYQVHSFLDTEPHFARDEIKDARQNKGKQWLGNGYYFWEHIMCAQLWVHQRGSNAKIYCAQIPFKKERERFLDLHSNTDDMITFYLLAKKVKEGMKKRNFDDNPTLNQIIYMLHSRNHFKLKKFIGIRYASPWNFEPINLAANTNEEFHYFQKIQYCIFEFAKDQIFHFSEYSLNEKDKELFSKLGI